jgi:hypothetical protein
MNIPHRILGSTIAGCLVFLSGCDQGNFISLQAVRVQCDKKFEIQVAITNPSPDSNNFGFSVGAFDNVASAAPNPPAKTFRGKEVVVLRVNGELDNPCQGGKLTLFSVGEKGGPPELIVDIPAPAIQSAVMPPNPVADANGEFQYAVTLTCCPAAAGAQNVQVKASKNATAGLAPNAVNCPGGPFPVQVTGKLTDPSLAGTVDIEVTNANSRCVIVTTIRPFG